MQRFRLFPAIFALFLFFSCGPQKGRIRIRGTFENLPQADLLIYSPDGGLSSVDTLHILKGQFDYSSPVKESPEPYTYVIVYPNYTTLTFFAHSGTDIRIKGDALSLNQVAVEGADSVVRDTAKAARNPLAVGRRLPKSKLIGKHIKRKPHQWFLIGFWAEWKSGSSIVTYNTSQALREHPDSLCAFTYSLDISPKAGKIRETIDSTRWKTYCDYTGWSGSLVTQYGIRNLPLMILVNPGDTIVALGSDYYKDIKPHLAEIGQTATH